MPASYRWALTLALVVGFQVALSAAFDVSEALHADAPSGYSEELHVPGAPLSPQVTHDMWLAQRSGYQTALLGMAPWRAVFSALLAVAAGLTVVFAMRLRLATEARDEAATWLGFAALGAAVARSIDGAQNLVIARTITAQTRTVLLGAGLQELELSLLTTAASVSSVAWSVLMVGTFMGLATYFRSDRVRAALARLEDE